MVNAFVISPKVENLVIKQTMLLKTVGNIEQEIKPSLPERKSQTLVNNELSLLEKQMSELRIELVQEIERLYNAFNQQENKKSYQEMTVLQAFNQLNSRDLIFRLQTVNFTNKKAIEVVEKLEKERKKPFTSLSDVIERVKIKNGKRETKAISEKKMLQIVDTWSQLSFHK
ncbi:MAG: hypothetical protein HC785_23690 [Calothrix sp. CSU_2_0]|nr:hypothetical protein [Calothrix sp. CSU_2_0]